ncbi:hypothetical protein [Paenibacillus lautus]|uniref:hypothetical protein n=1 Tax=Paenibacillus lautus TaxID=1401 RepID=UPI0039873EA1
MDMRLELLLLQPLMVNALCMVFDQLVQLLSSPFIFMPAVRGILYRCVQQPTE